MSKLRLRTAVIFLAFVSASIANAADFSFTFNWCEGSPEFNLKNVPKAASTLKLNMIDHDYRNGYSHGGATLQYSGQKKIECGAFNSQNWEPPQPPGGHIHRYEFTVDVFDKQGNAIATAKSQRQYGYGTLIADF